MSVLVTGGSGYFGSLLVQKLRAAGESCNVFDLRDAHDRPAEVAFMQGDVRDYDAVVAACQGCRVVLHNVAQVPLAKDRALFQSVNVAGTDNLLKAALAAGVQKVVYTSSSAVFGVPRTLPVLEETPPTPGEAYGRAKLDGERLCHEYSQRGLDVTIVRPRTILGHGRLGIFQILFEWIRTGNNIPVLGKGDNVYQFVHADDLADACILAGRRPGPSVFNIGAEIYGTMRGDLEHLCAAAGTGSRVKSVPMAPAVLAMRLTGLLRLSPLGAYHALMYGRSMYFDIAKAKRDLQWLPRYSNQEMLLQSYQWYVTNRERILAERDASHHRSAVKQGILSLLKWVI